MDDSIRLRATTDDEIINLFFERNESAIDECERKYGRLILSICAAVTGSREDAAECANDTYLRLWNSIPPEKPENLKAYSARIARNLAINRAEYNGAKKRGGGEIVSELDESVPDTADIYGYDLDRAIDSFLRALDKKSRVAFVLRYWYCEPLTTVARRLGCPESTVKSLLFRTRKKLKKYLEKEGVSL